MLHYDEFWRVLRAQAGLDSEIEDHARLMERRSGEHVCRGCLRPWSVAHHVGCSGRLR